MNEKTPERKSLRLQKFDYSQPGAYFVTICTEGRKCVLSSIDNDKVILSPVGEMISDVWRELPEKFDSIKLDEFVVMPNHIHGIISIVGVPLVGTSNRAGTRPAPTSNADIKKAGTRPAPTSNADTKKAGTRPAAPTLGEIIGQFKSVTTHLCIKGVREKNWPPFEDKFWQRNYYEHIIRNEEKLLEIREYIRNNPMNWVLDSENPSVIKLQGVAL